MELYYQPHKSRKREAAFVATIQKILPIESVINSYYPLPSSIGHETLDTKNILEWLHHRNTAQKRWNMLIEALKTLPHQVRVVTDIRNITCDVVIVKNGAPYFIEFHEEQHRTLSVDRRSHVFTLNDDPIEVPRYAQRFLRDIWRVKYLRPFAVIWADWFEANGLKESDILQESYSEKFLPLNTGFVDYLKFSSSMV